MQITSLTPAKKERLDQLNSQLWQAGLIGMLRGSIIGLVSGYYFNYKYNKGPNVKFFNTPYKILYLVSWNIVGIIFTTDVAKMKMSRHVAVEEEIKRNLYYQRELELLNEHQRRVNEKK